MSAETVNAYIAGIIDGEGSILLSRSRAKDHYRHPVVSVSSTTLGLLEFLKQHYGGHISSHKTYQDHHKKSWSWKIGYSSAIEILINILPYMLEPKKIYRAKLLIDVYPTVTKRNGKYTEEEMKRKLQFEEDFLKIP